MQKFHKEDANIFEIGVDEAGRGPLFGRVYTGAVVLPKDDSFDHSRVKDSKKFHSKKKIEEVAEYIKTNALYWSVSYEDEKIIDNALKEGYYISLKMCELAKAGMTIALNLADKSNVNLITDVGCGAELLKACFESGVFNSEINLKGIKDVSFAEKGKQVLRDLKKDMSELHKKTISKTCERMV